MIMITINNSKVSIIQGFGQILPFREEGEMMFRLFKVSSILFVLLLSCSLMAQQRTGTIYGKSTDEDGNPLPGVTVTLTGAKTAPLTSITSAE